MIRGVSKTAHILGVDRDAVKTMAFRFKEYLSQAANLGKEIARQFSAKDLQILAYVSMYWEDNPDYENIKVGLNRGDHNQEPYNNTFEHLTSFFQEPPEGLDETSQHGCLVGGLADVAWDTFRLADSYKLAGDKLVDVALFTEEVYELIRPIMFSYRHATELYLKAVLSSKSEKHDLKPLLEQLRDYLNRNHATAIPDWFEKIIFTFNDFDPGSTTFRYSDSNMGVFSRSTRDTGEFWVDLLHVKKLMGWLAKSFERIKQAQNKV
jgi:hypothetical protein